MQKSTIEFYKEAIKRAASAADVISKANAAYKREEKIYKGMLEDDLIGQAGFNEKIKNLEQEKNVKTKESLSRILKLIDEYSLEMAEFGKLDGSKIDDNTIKILNSGLALTSADWQQLADQHKNNPTMTRILQQRYEENRPKEKEPVAITFGQLPSERQEIFKRFIYKLHESCLYGIIGSLSGGTNFKTATDYYHHLAKKSIENMQPLEEENFDNLDTDFPIRLEKNGKPVHPVDPSEQKFNFNFTPIRNVNK